MPHTLVPYIFIIPLVAVVLKLKVLEGDGVLDVNVAPPPPIVDVQV